MLVDSHCHLNFPDFANDLEIVVNNAKKNGVKYLQTICTKMSDFNDILSIACRFEDVYCSVGVHPDEICNEDIINANEILKYINHKKVIGIGETGLDYKKKSFIEYQKKSFIEHISASRISGLPIIVHTRDAEDDTLNILQQEMNKGKFKGLIHCFTASKDFAYACIDLDMYISISGIVTFKNALSIQEIVKDLPLERLLIETDSPYLAPSPYRGKRNEPAYVVKIAEYIAELKNISFAECAKVTTNNFLSLFDKVIK